MQILTCPLDDGRLKMHADAVVPSPLCWPDEPWPPSLGGGTCDVAAVDVVGFPRAGAAAGLDGPS
jgi:hypothetical protein